MKLNQSKNEWKDELSQIREHLHQYPELSFQEYKTAEFICNQLEKWEIPYKKIGETGVFVDIVGNSEGPVIALRADIDALPIQEKSNVSFSSKHPNVMHACGHDGHTTILLGAVKQIYALKEELKGTVRCIFQPGEEADGAAKQLIELGVLKHPKIQQIVGLHLWPALPLGTVGYRQGHMTASCDDFSLVIEGKSGHAARPQEGIDAMTVGVQFMQQLKDSLIKKIPQTAPYLLHFGRFESGVANNVIADRCEIEGTIRMFDSTYRQVIAEEVSSILKYLDHMWGTQTTLNYYMGAPSIQNDTEIVNSFLKATHKIEEINEAIELSEPSLGADDFGYYSDEIPSLYFRLGIRDENGGGTFDLHHPQFNFSNDVLPLGVKVMVSTALELLKKGEY